MPVKSLIEFILYITPGFLALEVYRAVHPAKERSHFVQIAWSVIYGVVIFAIIKWVDQHYLNYALRSNSTSFPEFRLIIALLGAGLAVGGIGILLHFLAFRLSMTSGKLKWMVPNPQSVWAQINQRQNKDWAVVFLNDESVYIGWVKNYAFDPNAENQEFLLAKAKRVDEELNEKYIVDGIGVYLNTKDVKRIEFLKGQ